MERQTLNQIMELTASILAETPYTCIEAEWNGEDRAVLIYLDQPGGVYLDDCIRATKLLSSNPHLESILPDSCNLEVSSPGIERPLRRPQDFLPHVGKKISVRLYTPAEKKKKGVGILTGIDDLQQISVDLPEGRWVFPLTAVKTAKLVVDVFNPDAGNPSVT